jgi:hypothetical protein
MKEKKKVQHDKTSDKSSEPPDKKDDPVLREAYETKSHLQIKESMYSA